MCGICPTLTKANLQRGQHGYADEYHGGGKPMLNIPTGELGLYLTGVCLVFLLAWVVA